MIAELAAPAAPAVPAVPQFAPLGADAPVAAVLERIEAAGVIGMGGGGYPTARKIRQAIAAGADVAIGNGMGSEPNAGADAALLRDHCAEVLTGLALVARCLGAAHAILAVPPGCVRELPTLPAESPVSEVSIAEGPPGVAGGEERRLTAALTERSVPQDRHPTDAGVLVLNVATLFAVHDAVRAGRALQRRIVAVGDAEYWVPLGTPLADLPLAGDGAYRVRGALTGNPAPDNAVVDATTFSVAREPEQRFPCIGCGWCVPACPEALHPEQLHEAFEAGKAGKASAGDAAVFSCIECGACTAACPSNLDLVNAFRALKARTRRSRAAEQRAALARQRSSARTQRLAQRAQALQEQREARLRAPHDW